MISVLLFMFYHSGICLISLDVSSSQEGPAEDETDENRQNGQTKQTGSLKW